MQAELGVQLEIAGGAVPDEEGVLLAVGLPDDRPVLDRPEFRIAFPAGEVLAVEERLELVGVQRSGERDDALTQCWRGETCEFPLVSIAKNPTPRPPSRHGKGERIQGCS